MRSIELAALAAAREVNDPAEAAAARAAGFAASSAYTHPLADVQQTKHILGPAAHAALALELERGGDPVVGDAELRRAIQTTPAEVRALLLQMPARSPGKGRLDGLLCALDKGILSPNVPRQADAHIARRSLVWSSNQRPHRDAVDTPAALRDVFERKGAGCSGRRRLSRCRRRWRRHVRAGNQSPDQPEDYRHPF